LFLTSAIFSKKKPLGSFNTELTAVYIEKAAEMAGFL
jgi:hypothetical protein